MTCTWCGEPFEPLRRSDALTCGPRCRQARHRAIRDKTALRAAGTCDIGPIVPETASTPTLPSRHATQAPTVALAEVAA